MRWFLISCFLLAFSADALSKPRPKRDLSYIKNLVSSKLFGRETIIIELPEISDNEAYRLFKIQGYDNILIKVIRKPKKTFVKDEVPPKEDPVIVSAEIAIIGNYLGTTTQGETLLAVEVAKNLMKSGILNGIRGNVVKKVEVPVKTPQVSKECSDAKEPVKPDKEETIHIAPCVSDKGEQIKIKSSQPGSTFTDESLPFILASEMKIRPAQTKYSYVQKGEDADMTYESYNNQDVIVTRTTKEPPLPQYLKMRFADVATIAANPYLIISQKPIEIIEENYQPLQIVTGAYGYLSPTVLQKDIQAVPIPSFVAGINPTAPKPKSAVEEPGYVIASNIKSPSDSTDKTPMVSPEPLTIPNFIKRTKPHFEDKLTNEEIAYINQILNTIYNENSSISASQSNSSQVSQSSQDNVLKSNANNAVVGSHKSNNSSTDVNDEMVTRYFYKQINHNSVNNYTVVNVEESPKTHTVNNSAKSNVVKSTEEIPNDFLYLPPENVNLPAPNMVPKKNTGQNYKKSNENFSAPKINKFKIEKAISTSGGKLRTSDHSMKNAPIVVLEDNSNSKQNSVTNYKEDNENFVAFTGGSVF